VKLFRKRNEAGAAPAAVRSVAGEPTAERLAADTGEQVRLDQLTRIVAWTEPEPRRRPEREKPADEAEAS